MSLVFESIREVRKKTNNDLEFLSSSLPLINTDDFEAYSDLMSDYWVEVAKAGVILPSELTLDIMEPIAPLFKKTKKFPIIWRRFIDLGAKYQNNGGLSGKDQLVLMNTYSALENMFILPNDTIRGLTEMIENSVALSNKLKSKYKQFFIVE